MIQHCLEYVEIILCPGKYILTNTMNELSAAYNAMRPVKPFMSQETLKMITMPTTNY